MISATVVEHNTRPCSLLLYGHYHKLHQPLLASKWSYEVKVLIQDLLIRFPEGGGGGVVECCDGAG